jgi:hypothetical protein
MHLCLLADNVIPHLFPSTVQLPVSEQWSMAPLVSVYVSDLAQAVGESLPRHRLNVDCRTVAGVGVQVLHYEMQEVSFSLLTRLSAR